MNTYVFLHTSSKDPLRTVMRISRYRGKTLDLFPPGKRSLDLSPAGERSLYYFSPTDWSSPFRLLQAVEWDQPRHLHPRTQVNQSWARRGRVTSFLPKYSETTKILLCNLFASLHFKVSNDRCVRNKIMNGSVGRWKTIGTRDIFPLGTSSLGRKIPVTRADNFSSSLQTHA